MTLEPQLAALSAAGVIRLVQEQPELEYLFRHALVQAAACQSLLKQNPCESAGLLCGLRQQQAV